MPVSQRRVSMLLDGRDSYRPVKSNVLCVAPCVVMSVVQREIRFTSNRCARCHVFYVELSAVVRKMYSLLLCQNMAYFVRYERAGFSNTEVW